MDKIEIADKRIIKLVNVLQQIEDVDRMIELHMGDESKSMLNQYRYRRERFLAKLGELLGEFKVKPSELVGV
jgi:hypothetical protein